MSKTQHKILKSVTELPPTPQELNVSSTDAAIKADPQSWHMVERGVRVARATALRRDRFTKDAGFEVASRPTEERKAKDGAVDVYVRYVGSN